MLRKFIRHIVRPLVGEQDTARLAYQRYQGLAFTGVNGNGGHGYRRSLSATGPATIAPGPTHVVRDPASTGNNSAGLIVQPLSEDALTQAINGAKQF